MSVMASRPLLRWVVPAGVVAVVLGGGAITTALTASADAQLPARSTAQLLVDLATARLDGVSGTVVERADLGLPSLPSGVGGDGSADLNSLISGSHTLRVWYSGQDKARIALLGTVSETDVVYNGTDGYVWSSTSNTATHYKAPSGSTDKRPRALPSGLPSDLPMTPQQAADKLLAAVSPTTSVTSDGSTVVAGHPAYQLVVEPKDKASLVASVRVAIDGTAHVPTRVQVYAKGHEDKPAFEIGFTQVSFSRPDNGVFTFSPPPGVKITEADKGNGAPSGDKTEGQPKTAQIGKGWTTVLVAKLPADTSTPDKSDQRGQAQADAFLNRLPQVHTAAGTGRMLESRLFSALLLDDGRVLIGAVTPDRLIAAAADPAAALK